MVRAGFYEEETCPLETVICGFTMKGGLRLALCVTFLLFFSLYLLEAHLRDICNQYRAGAYLADWLDHKGPVQSPVFYNGIPEDKVIVMAKLEEEHTDWVAEQLPEYVLSSFVLFKISTNYPLSLQ